MKNIKYIRDSHSKALLLVDKIVIEDFLQKKSIDAKIEELQSSINTLKDQMKQIQENIHKKDYVWQ